MPAKDTYARFYIHPSLISGSVKAKDAKYEDVIFAEIFIKGSTNTSFGRAKRDSDEEEYAEEWTAYVNKDVVKNSGTHLSALPTIGPSAQMNLNAKGINSVEELAVLDDAWVIGERGMFELRKKAQAYLEALHPEQAEAKKREQEDLATHQAATIEDMKLEMAQMKEALANATIVEKPKKPKKGKK